MMGYWWLFLLGLLGGWLIELAIDYTWWRKRHRAAAEETARRLGEIEQLRKDLESRESRLALRERDAGERETVQSGRDADLLLQAKRIDERGEAILRTEQRLDARRAELEQLSSSLGERDRAGNDRLQVIKQAETRFADRQSRLDAADSEAAKREAMLGSRESGIKRWEQRVLAKEKELHGLEAEAARAARDAERWRRQYHGMRALIDQRYRRDDGADDLTVIQGINRPAEGLLNDLGITSFVRLAETPLGELSRLAEQGGPDLALADPMSWAEQAALLVDRDFIGFESLKARLRGDVPADELLAATDIALESGPPVVEGDDGDDEGVVISDAEGGVTSDARAGALAEDSAVGASIGEVADEAASGDPAAGGVAAEERASVPRASDGSLVGETDASPSSPEDPIVAEAASDRVGTEPVVVESEFIESEFIGSDVVKSDVVKSDVVEPAVVASGASDAERVDVVSSERPAAEGAESRAADTEEAAGIPTLVEEVEAVDKKEEGFRLIAETDPEPGSGDASTASGVEAGRPTAAAAPAGRKSAGRRTRAGQAQLHLGPQAGPADDATEASTSSDPSEGAVASEVEGATPTATADGDQVDIRPTSGDEPGADATAASLAGSAVDDGDTEAPVATEAPETTEAAEASPARDATAPVQAAAPSRARPSRGRSRGARVQQPDGAEPASDPPEASRPSTSLGREDRRDAGTAARPDEESDRHEEFEMATHDGESAAREVETVESSPAPSSGPPGSVANRRPERPPFSGQPSRGGGRRRRR